MSSYYASNGIEAIDIIEAFDLDFCEGNVLKYISRAGRKGDNDAQDYAKALYYDKRRLLHKAKHDVYAICSTHMIDIIHAFGHGCEEAERMLYDVLTRAYKLDTHRQLLEKVLFMYDSGITEDGYRIEAIEHDTMWADLVSVSDRNDKKGMYLYNIPKPTRWEPIEEADYE